MPKHSAALAVFCLVLMAAPTYAQQCLHESGETAEQAVRRRAALTATRNINNIQANQPGALKGQFLRHDQLSNSPFALKIRESNNDAVKSMSLEPGTDVLPDWQLTLNVTEQGYWFMIKDRTDPCGFAFISNQQGLIFRAEPIR